MSPEVAAKNKAWLEKRKAQREAQAAAKAGKEPKKFMQPKLEDVKAAVAQHVEDVKQAAAKQKKTSETITLRELKGSAKQKWPRIKGLADATAKELARVLEYGEQEPKILVELQEVWAKRARTRREAWLKGDSKSAKAARDRKSIPHGPQSASEGS